MRPVRSSAGRFRRACFTRARQGIRAALAVAGAALACAVAYPGSASAASPFLITPAPEVAERTAAYRYANMTDAEAFAELDRRKIIHTKLAATPGVRAPVRLTGRLHGVWFHSSLPPDERVASAFEILDARLALALDDFAAVLERHDVVEVMHFTMYRPNVAAPDGVHEGDEQAAPILSRTRNGKARPSCGKKCNEPPKLDKGTGKKSRSERTVRGSKQKGTPAARPPAKGRGGKGAASRPTSGKVAKREAEPKRGHPKTTWAPPGTRHPAGLAIDVGGLRKRDGRWLSVGYHFHGSIGDKTCGAGARAPETPEAKELRSIVCEANDLGIFTYVLTPNYNAAHADHFHMEIKPGVHWFLYH